MMKKICFVLLALFLAQPSWAAIPKKKNTATYITFEIVNASTGALISGATGLDCERSGFDDGTNPPTFSDVNGTETEIGTTGTYYVALNTTDTNFDYIYIQCKSSSSNAMTWTGLIDTIHGTVLTNSSGQLSTGTIAASSFSSGAIDATAIAADAIGASELAADAIGSSEIATDAIGAAEIAADAIGASELAADAIGSSEIATDAIGAAEIASNAIGDAEIADNSFTRATYAADGTLQAATSNTATLASAETYADNALANRVICITANTGAGQCRVIASNVGTTDVVTIYNTWQVTPDNTSGYQLGGTSDGNVIAWDSSDVPAASVAGRPLVDISHINGSSTASNSATLSLKQLNIVNSTGSAIVASSTGSNGTGIAASGNGSGSGLSATAGATGTGAQFVGGGTSGSAISATTTSGDGITVTPSGSNKSGLVLSSTGTGVGLSATLGTDAVTAAVISSAAANKVADHVLRRNTSNVESSSNGDTLDWKSLYGATAKQVHPLNVSGSNLNIYKADGTTLLKTQTITTTSGAQPITGIGN